jgi:hypothetical protein
VSGPLRLPAIDEDEAPRLAAFRTAHPEVVIGDLGFGKVWQARIAEDNGETVITRYVLRDLLDKLDAIFLALPGRAALAPRRRALGGRARPAGVASGSARCRECPGWLARPRYVDLRRCPPWSRDVRR